MATEDKAPRAATEVTGAVKDNPGKDTGAGRGRRGRAIGPRDTSSGPGTT